jgi:hypothetical protein
MGRRAGRRLAAELAAGVAAVVAAVAVGASENATGVQQVNEAQAKAVQAVTLLDGEYGRIDEGRATALSVALSAQISRPAPPPPPGTPLGVPELAPVLAFGAPKRLQLAREPALPGLVAARRTGLRRWQVETAPNLRIVAVNLADGAVTSSRLIGSPKRQAPPAPSMSRPRPEGVNAAAIGTGVMPFANVLTDLIGYGKSWSRGRYAFTVVEFDWVSNTVVVEMTGGSAAPATPAARKPFPPLLARRDELPAAHEGVDFRLPPPAEPGAPQQVQVALALPPGHGVLAKTDVPGASLLVGSLLLLRLDAEQPLRADLAIPVRTPAADARVQVLFSFDLKAALPAGLPRGSYQTYLCVWR